MRLHTLLEDVMEVEARMTAHFCMHVFAVVVSVSSMAYLHDIVT